MLAESMCREVRAERQGTYMAREYGFIRDRACLAMDGKIGLPMHNVVYWK
ncbi:MAG: hypothetical protein RMJ59_01075 [Candidatus Nitrosocaldus sp.]|nr:hypothetical protein [Candidatus Nitrosocaldus sp.]MDW8274957.1 hypothetical protein [Candidatus Nitrosocaldus sp.]